MSPPELWKPKADVCVAVVSVSAACAEPERRTTGVAAQKPTFSVELMPSCAPSGVASRKTGPAREPYNRLSRGTSLLLEAWNREGPRMVSLAAALNSSPAATDRLRMLTAVAASAEVPASWLRDRLQHFIREDARAIEALSAFERADTRALGELAADSQRDAELLLGNQVPETSALAASARPLGAFAASNFGAGFGGAVWALVDARDAAAFARKWHARSFVAGAALPLTDLSTT